MEILKALFTSGDFMPHGYCFMWDQELVWLHVVSDSLIFLSYVVISLTLGYFVYKRLHLPFSCMFVRVRAFMIACGFRHPAEDWTIWRANVRKIINSQFSPFC